MLDNLNVKRSYEIYVSKPAIIWFAVVSSLKTRIIPPSTPKIIALIPAIPKIKNNWTFLKVFEIPIHGAATPLKSALGPSVLIIARNASVPDLYKSPLVCRRILTVSKGWQWRVFDFLNIYKFSLRKDEKRLE